MCITLYTGYSLQIRSMYLWAMEARYKNGQEEVQCWAIDGQGELVKIHLYDVLYVPKLICNLLSVSAIRRRGFMTSFLSDDDGNGSAVLKQKSSNILMMGKELSEGL
ncbi:hypothetical protein BWQ96_04276 [Gracilariopsis chorda]|uniref:Retrovirus-related Pol polyprotein from transposon TNT 1-94-like beta-barrel domain-containing protein n=1 Tax=Gracilariopsis chorda TaxID=448386 RepID=A0A2V3IV45_9FLOR|nr:hypothetical protein BWQ96_04276 [Gracilariopsis chorda]|eukprot:PXF45963.1 hypothetical protein BWQ96_04276 [Gracilariopsis chorda]